VAVDVGEDAAHVIFVVGLLFVEQFDDPAPRLMALGLAADFWLTTFDSSVP